MFPSWAERKIEGSTLELLAGVIILGMLAVLLVPLVALSNPHAREHLEARHTAALKAAVDRYYIENNDWPADLAELVPNYVPEGIPTPPYGGVYHFSATTNRVLPAP